MNQGDRRGAGSRGGPGRGSNLPRRTYEQSERQEQVSRGYQEGGGGRGYRGQGREQRERQASEQEMPTCSSQQRGGGGRGSGQGGQFGHRGGGGGTREQCQGRGSFHQRRDMGASSSRGQSSRGGGAPVAYQPSDTRTGGYRQETSGYQKGGHDTRKPTNSGPQDQLRNVPDPYSQPKDLQMYKKDLNWKPFAERQKDVVLHQRPTNPATWAERRIDVSVNHFPIIGIPKIMFQYDIKCELFRVRSEQTGGGDQAGQSPEGRRVPKDLTEAILKYLLPILGKQTGNAVISTNFSSNLFTTVKLEDLRLPLQHVRTVAQLKKAEVISKESADERAESRYVVTFQFANEGGTRGVINTTPFGDHMRQNDGSLKGFRFTPEMKQTVEAALNAYTKSVLQFPFYSVGRSTIVPYNAPGSSLGGGLMAWKGFSMNITMGWKPFLNLEITNTAMVKGTNVLDVIIEFLNLKGRDKASMMDQILKHLDKVKAFLKTVKVEYMVKNNKRSKVVQDVFHVGANHPGCSFEWEGSSATVCEYFRGEYGVTLEYPNGPLLVVNPNKSKIPAELCFIKDGQSVNRKLSGDQTKKMLKFAVKKPQEHYNDTLNQFKELQLHNSPILKGLGIHVPNGGMHKITNARVLVAPAIRYGGKVDGGDQTKVALLTPSEGTWKHENFKFYKPAPKVEKWGLLVVGCSDEFENHDNYGHLKKFIKLLKQQAQGKGLNIVGDPIEKYDYDCKNTDEAASTKKNQVILKNLMEDFRKAGCQLVFVVFPSKVSSLYGHVKHVAETDVGILTQGFQLESIVGPWKEEHGTNNRYRPGPTASVVQTLLPKLNTKLGGINHVTVAPLNKTLASMFCTLLMDCPVLILGADVTHPPPGSKKLIVKGEEPYSPSYAAVTGTLDKTCMPYITEVRAQSKANAGAAEVIQDLEAIVKNMLTAFWNNSDQKLLPLKIIYFRDGVGEGQFPEVLCKEMTAIQKACESCFEQSVIDEIIGKGRKYEPKITFFTVQKRHKVRIFYHGYNGIENAPAGTVIDEDIVHPTETGFYIVSHRGQLGTSRASYYRVLWDDSDFSLDQLQSLAYTLCYMYARCTKSVKMPAPTYYAHLAADRAKKLCEGFETKYGEPIIENLNRILAREPIFLGRHPMHFI